MNIDQIKQVFASAGKQVTDTSSEGYYKVDGGKARSERSLMREAKAIEKQMKKAAKRGAA